MPFSGGTPLAAGTALSFGGAPHLAGGAPVAFSFNIALLTAFSFACDNALLMTFTLFRALALAPTLAGVLRALVGG